MRRVRRSIRRPSSALYGRLTSLWGRPAGSWLRRERRGRISPGRVAARLAGRAARRGSR
jgi:hypothetical protein